MGSGTRISVYENQLEKKGENKTWWMNEGWARKEKINDEEKKAHSPREKGRQELVPLRRTPEGEKIPHDPTKRERSGTNKIENHEEKMSR